MVDGRGCERVLDVVEALSSPKLHGVPVTLRRAASDDVRQIWRLANDPTLRANSFDRPEIPFPDHFAWYAGKLADADVLYLVVDIGGMVAAQVRYERSDDGTAEVHFAVAAAFRGKGLGTRVLVQSWPEARERLGVSRIRGVVRRSNPASVRAFQSAGYSVVDEIEQRGFECYLFEKEIAK
jgi:RimJ/RimL family protein N-acetyltransferase